MAVSLDMQWDAGKLVDAKVRNVSGPDGKFRVLYMGTTKDFQVEKGQTQTLTAATIAK